jgi:hypothetical protein
MKTIARIADYLAWTSAVVQLFVLLSTCVSGFTEMQLGLAVIGQVAFFGFLCISTLAGESRVPARNEVRQG